MISWQDAGWTADLTGPECTWCCCAQVKARLLAEAEEQEARRLTLDALEALLEKVRRKMQLFDAMADALRRETANVEVRLPALPSKIHIWASGPQLCAPPLPQNCTSSCCAE